MRKRRTNAELKQLDEQMLTILQEDHPQSVRHVFYRMTDPTLPVYVPKTDKGENNGYKLVQRRLTKLRKEGRLSYGWIIDMTRRGYFVSTYDSAADFVKRMASTYRGELWKDADCHLEVWCESRSIAGIVQEVCEEYCVDLYPAGGFSSLSLTYDSAVSIWNKTNAGQKPAHVLYIGDYDPAGVLIDKNIESSILAHLGDDFPLYFNRIGINPEQIEQYNLPSKPRKANDKRSLHIKETVEAEAMPAKLMREILREQIEKFIPKRQLKIAHEAEKSEKEFLLKIADVMAG